MHFAFVQEKSFLDIQICLDLSVILNLLYYNFYTPNKVSPMNSRDFFLLKVTFLFERIIFMTPKIVSNAITFPDLANVNFKFPGISKDPLMTTIYNQQRGIP